ncbi:hypothetical protein [Tissierella sp. Yu-01]|uniref:hypothetical protein n=1 Tax=Tissierella sp. Yu-01 TaxID=3035694 RepID=UPI00240DAD82|nr:hypothetical protein [Tissierella sp. Yu-01]WFA08226.1 hypothetical protein P3962_10860 [Tissierella sp. Yu-01]
MKKKILSLLLAVFTLIVFATPVTTYAESMPTLKSLSREELIKQDEIAAENGYDKFITSFKVNEYDALMNLKKKSEATLRQQGLSSADIKKIKEFDVDNIIIELKNKSDKELEMLGYTKERIEKIKDYDGTDVSIQGIFSDLYCEVHFSRHEYDRDDRTTTFRVRFDWEWDVMPVVTKTDIIGAVVSEGMYFDDDLSYHRIYYYDVDDDRNTEIYDFYPTDEIHAMETTFDLREGSYYAMRGRAYCAFTKSGRVPEAAMVIRYGHSTYSAHPSVSVSPDDLGLSFEPVHSVKTMNPDDYYIHSRDYGERVRIR